VNDESAVRIGHMLGVDAVTIGTLTKVGNKISVNIKVVDVESGSLLSSGSIEIDGSEYIEMYNELLYQPEPASPPPTEAQASTETQASNSF